MDNFREEIVVRRKSGLYTMMYYLSWVIMIICALIAMISLSSVFSVIGVGTWVDIVINVVTLLIFGGLAFLIFRKKDELRTEYEYTLTNSDLDVAKVLNNSRRRYLTALSLKNVEACGEVETSSNTFQRYLTMKDVKKHNWFLNRDAKLYYFYFTKNSVKHMIVLELSDEMAEMIRKSNHLGFGVWQK